MALLELASCSKAFGGLRAVDGVSFSLEPEALIGLIGPNGAGKTTIFNLLTGVYEPTEGTIRLDGVSIGGRSPNEIARRGIARTFQNIRLFPNLTVLENVRIACQLHGAEGLRDAVLRTKKHYRSEAA